MRRSVFWVIYAQNSLSGSLDQFELDFVEREDFLEVVRLKIINIGLVKRFENFAVLMF